MCYSPTLGNTILQELNLNDLCKYNNTHQAYLYKDSNKIVNFSYILAFLKQSTCYAITPDIPEWQRIIANEIADNHKIALCNDLTVHLVPLPLAEPSDINAVETIARLTLSQIHKDHANDAYTQSTYSNSALTSSNINNSPQNNTVHPPKLTTVILQQFSMITQELRNFTDKSVL